MTLIVDRSGPQVTVESSDILSLSVLLLQVLPSASISYFVYEFMKIVLKVEST